MLFKINFLTYVTILYLDFRSSWIAEVNILKLNCAIKLMLTLFHLHAMFARLHCTGHTWILHKIIWLRVQMDNFGEEGVDKQLIKGACGL